jgi:hypothetical protein
MTLDIHILEGGGAGQLLLSIDENAYAALEPAFSIYRRKTGLFIDPYGTLKMSSGFKPLIEAIDEAMTQISENKGLFTELRSLLIDAEKSGHAIILEGD